MSQRKQLTRLSVCLSGPTKKLIQTETEEGKKGGRVDSSESVPIYLKLKAVAKVNIGFHSDSSASTLSPETGLTVFRIYFALTVQ